jgi:hypothetical protein
MLEAARGLCGRAMRCWVELVSMVQACQTHSAENKHRRPLVGQTGHEPE